MSKDEYTREIDREYTDWIRSLPCSVRQFGGCRGLRSHGHHTDTRGSGGSDLRQIPLCAAHHTLWHEAGRDTFCKWYDIDIDGLIQIYQLDYAKMNRESLGQSLGHLPCSPDTRGLPT